MEIAVHPRPRASLREILASLHRDRWKILAAAALTFLAACLLAFALPARYTARSTLLVLLGSEYTVRPEAGSQTLVNDALDREQILKSEIGILGSDDLHLAVISSIGVGRLYPRLLQPPGRLAQARAALRDLIDQAQLALGLDIVRRPTPEALDLALTRFDDALDIVPVKDGSIVDVSFRHQDPELAAAAVNTLVTLYLQRRQAVYVDTQSAMLRDQMAAVRGQLDAATKQLTEFKTGHGIVDFAAERGMLLHQRDELAVALHEADDAVAQATGRLAALKAQLAAMPPTITQYTDTDSDARLATLRNSIQELQGRRDGLLAHYLPESRPVTELRDEIAARQAEFDRLRGDASVSASRIGRNATYDALDLDRDRVGVELQAAQARRQVLAAQLADVDAGLHRLDENEPALQRLTRQLEVAEDNYRTTARLLQDRVVIEDVAARRAANVRVVQPARVPVRPGSLAGLILLAGVLLSAMAGAATAMLADFARSGFISAERLERTLRIPVLASVPESSALAAPALTRLPI
ncbi:MAG: hypothetical protein JO264_06070 [Acidisphaera sp.]|nr:hypothetical protein [Acidisphaera sp.]